eukprot:Gb_24415 [translate_table: standard]
MENSCCFRISCIMFLCITVGRAYGSSSGEDGLISCLQTSGVTNITTSSHASRYNFLLKFSLQNLRYTEPSVRKPYAIVIPQSRRQVQKSVVCCIQQGWEIRVRSGGHSYEGLSSTSDVPFVLIDLMNLSKVDVDMVSKTAWVEAGATLGEVYSAISDRTKIHGFPAGVCPTVGSSGHFGGGGLGFLTRKYGLAADNVIDALLIDSSGKVLNKKSMGEDVFWALRGGGGGSWGVVIAWKIRLVSVPPSLTVFSVLKTGRNQVTDLVHRWQSIAPFLEDDLFIRVQISSIQLQDGERDTRASFQGMYLGPLPHLLKSINKSFPELGLAAHDCNETSWIESILYFGDTNRSELSNRYYSGKIYFKNKSDLSRSPIPKSGLDGAWPILEEELGSTIILSPLGGVMGRISSSELPFPYRAGTLFDIQYVVTWNESGKEDHHIAWMRKLYKYMAPYMSKALRGAYVNYLDLDLGSAVNGTSTVEEARAWGEKYFMGNFDRLVKAKTKIDPHNVFRNSQSIPVMT